MNDSMTTKLKAGWTQGTGRSRHCVISAVCLTALGLGALVATGPVEAAPVLPEQATPTPTPTGITTEAALRNAVTNVGGIINVGPGNINLTAQLEIRRNGTQLRAVDPANTTLTYTGSPSTSRSRVLEVWATGVIVDGLKITGGRTPIDDGGGGVEVEAGASLTLSRSWVTGNVDDFGGGVLNEGTLTVVDSTISGNTASIKGGGLLNERTATVTNSTIEGNRSPLGAGITSFSTINVAHSTIVRNVNSSTSTSSSSVAGLQQYGGTFNVRYSIVADNLLSNGAAARNCGGTVSVRDVNLVSTTTGCTTSGTVLTGGPMVGPLQNNGGPTPTAAPLDGSKAINAVALAAGKCVSGSTADQRGTARPSGPKCELGSFEIAALSFEASLGVDTSAYTNVDPGTVETGATSVPTNKIAAQVAAQSSLNPDGTVNAASLRSVALEAIGSRDVTLADLALQPVAAGIQSAELKANSLRSVSLRSVSLRSVSLRSVSLRSVSLRSVSLRSVPLSEIPLLQPGGWSELLAGTLFEGLPLQSITLADLVEEPKLDGLSLESIDLSSTSLRSVSLRSVMLAGVSLRSVPLPVDAGQPTPTDYSAIWCQTLFGADVCDPTFTAEVGDMDLLEAQLGGGNVDQPKVLSVPLAGLSSAGSLDAASLRSVSLRSVSLRSVFLENTSLRSVSLRSVDPTQIGAILRCNDPSNPCSTAPTNTLTLGDAVAGCLPADAITQGGSDSTNCLLQPNATVGDLLDLLGVKDVNGVSLLDGLTLFDILFAFAPPEDIPWEAVNLETSSLQNIADPATKTFHYLTTVTVTNGPATVDISLSLPAGFVLAGGANPESATWCPASTPACPTTLPTPTSTVPKYSITNVPSGSYILRVPVRAGTIVGDGFKATATVGASGPNGAPGAITTPSVEVSVVQSGTGAAPSAPILSDGKLQLGYIGGSGELDAYSFIAPAGSTGASARILLSNIPDGVDYDLTVYGLRPTSLRGTPTKELSSLGDVRYGLDPDKDALETDLVNDIAVDINDVAKGISGLGDVTNYALRDISSRRSNNDEEVTLPALNAGTKYVVVVSGYFGDISPKPYGLRIRLDRRNALPVCAGPGAYPGALTPTATVPTSLDVENGIDTLYVTNGARLDAESSGRSEDVISSIARTDGVNSVDAGLLLVDGLSEWSEWNANSCSPDARNAVAIAIGNAIDDANTAAGGTIENIVIVGGDGVIPMAAVPDLTKYSNEATFAREVLSPTAAGLRSNAVAGTVGSGYLLSDDPYATTAGISVLGGDHELYVPDRNIGRLIETADEIIGQLDNFQTYGGKLDPTTFEAAVTGYDFLTDGAQAITAELGDQQFTVSELSDNAWDKNSFYALFGPDDSGKSKYSVYSPNAHYDYESLLPAAADAAADYTDDDLVTTADFREGPLGELPAAFAPVAALGFTVGCHAGLSVSDVQLGLPALDWAQLASSNQSQWIGHTTYGYGDTKIVAYSERLAKLFAGNVAGIAGGTAGAPESLGAAVRDAKQRYLASTLVLTPYDEKILQSWTYYGLPMYTIGNSVPAAPAARTGAPVEETTTTTTEPVTTDSTTTTTTTAPPNESTTTTSSTTTTTTTTTTVAAQPLIAGIMRAGALTAQAASGPVTFTGNQVSIDLRGSRLARTDVGADGSYYSVDGNTAVAQYRPIQPLVDVAIPDALPGAFGGFLITGLTSDDLPRNYVPFYARPLVDNSVDEGRIIADDGAFPATLQRIADLESGQRLLVAAGQYQGGQRLFRQINGELIPRLPGSTDTDAPRFLDVSGTNVPNSVPVSGSTRSFKFDVTTDENATRVVIVYREEGRPSWSRVELGQVGGNAKVWTGTAQLISSNAATKAEFFAQSVDAAGNVGLTSNKIENFLAVDEALVPPVSGAAPTIVPGTKNQVDGQFFETGATFTVAPSTATVRVDGFPLAEYDSTKPITLIYDGLSTQPSYDKVDGKLRLNSGSHTIEATNGSFAPVVRTFIVDPDGPTVTFRGDTGSWTQGPVSLFVDANDGSGSGMDNLCVDGDCTATDANGVLTAGPLTIAAADNTVVQRTVAATATDRLGNQSLNSLTVRIDRVLPTATLSVTPDSNNDGIYGPTETVTATFSCADADSGVTTCELLDGGTVLTSTTTGASTAFPITNEGSTNLTVRATDQALNQSTTSPTTIRIDTIKPVVTFTITGDTNANGYINAGETAVANFSCDDTSGSGVASCELLNGATKLSGTSPYTITSEGPLTLTVNAIDNAGNEAEPKSANVNIDTIKPVVTITKTPAQEWWNGDVTVNITATDTGGSGVDTACVKIGAGSCDTVTPVNGIYGPITAPGSSDYTVNATDTAGNQAVSKSTTVNIEKVKPVVTFTKTPDREWWNGDVIVTFTATDTGGSGLNTVCITTPTGCTTTTPSNGIYGPITVTATTTITVAATDNANNTTTESATINIDRVKPTAALSVSADGNGDGIYNFGETATATFSCGDVGSGVASCELLDGGTVVATAAASPFTIVTSTTGTKTLTVRARDLAGNSFTSPATTLNVGFRTCEVSTTQSFLLPISTVRLKLCDAAGTNLSTPTIIPTALAINGTRDPIVNFSGLTLTYRFTYNTAGRFYEYTFFNGGLPGRVDHTLSFTTKQPAPNRNIGVPALNRLATNTVTFRLR